MNPLKNERGFSILLLCLMVLLVMTALGAAMLQTTQRELRSVNKLKLSTQAFYSAESGVQLATAELNAIDEDTIIDGSYTHPQIWADEFINELRGMRSEYTPSQTEFVFDNADYNVSGMRFETTVSFVGADSNPLDMLCYGKKGTDYVFEVGTLQEFYDANKLAGTDFWPVIIVTARGEEGHKPGGLFKYARTRVQIMTRAEPNFIFPEAALTLNGSLTSNGNPQSAIGEGHPSDTESCDVADIVGVDDTIFGYTGNTGDETKIEKKDTAYPINEVIAMLKPLGEEIIDPPNNPNWDEEKVRWHDGDITVNNLNGNGVLIVIGNLTAGGNIAWNGLILVTGDFVMNGGGTYTKYIHGSVVIGGNVTGNGNPDIYFDCEYLLDLWKSTAKWDMKWWKQVRGGS